MPELPELGDLPLKETIPVNPMVAGFSGAAAAVGLRSDGREDLALISAPEAVPAAGLFTTNPVTAAPVQVCRAHLASGRARAVLANCGCANAATGEAGMEACKRTVAEAARVLGCRPEEVLPASTGVIGQVLDAGKVCAGLPELARGLNPEGLEAAAGAIMTTDQFRKMARREIVLGNRPVAVLGLAKGAGMIRPDMATMLAFVLTDADASAQALAAVLKPAAGLSFHRATVDGDMSTNDTLILMASGKAGNPRLGPDDAELSALQEGVTGVCQDLAAMLVADGEGAGHLVRVLVTGAQSEEAARHICLGVAHSPLCKTAFAGRDPNWGRFLSAAGAEAVRRGLEFRPEGVDIWVGDAKICAGGVYTSSQGEQRAFEVMSQDRWELRLDLGLGKAHYWVLTSDLDHKYIDINVDYRS